MIKERNIQTRRQLFDFLQGQMMTAYESLLQRQRLDFESTLIKSYVIEVDVPTNLAETTNDQHAWMEFLNYLFKPLDNTQSTVQVQCKEEKGFFELNLNRSDQRALIYVDCITDQRFWIVYTISNSKTVDWWLESLIKIKPELDLVWFWPSFLESIQNRGIPKGFGLDYDYRKFEGETEERTTYLKMQLWGGRDTKELYDLLRDHEVYGDKTVLSKVRLKELGNGETNEHFALQDVKFNGKFTVRGTDFSTHAATLSSVRKSYRDNILNIENEYSLRWCESESNGGIILKGSPLHFIPPEGYRIPITTFCDRALNSALPFRLLGFKREMSESSAVVEVVDFHTGGEFSMEIFPDVLSVYLPEETCGNSIARLYTNLQHYLNARFTLETDDGKQIL
ncbi:MAG: hypothetical protein P9X24_09030 [Candidatus Hatepunaea meridiana]|nr:hypothetical protein [Candidatus Hatepunaea meridiana]